MIPFRVSLFGDTLGHAPTEAPDGGEPILKTKRILTGAAVALALLLPVTAIAANHPDARGGEGWWPQSQTR